jgi:cation diffusion facilitator CzcD-associated flavoprotein CzcO
MLSGFARLQALPARVLKDSSLVGYGFGARMTVTADHPVQHTNGSQPRHSYVAILGAGLGGLGAAIRLKQEGVEDFVIFERDTEVGGTWWANSYPGCQCDIPSHLYSYSFAPNPEWTRTYPLQAELGRYARDCAERFGVLEHARLGCEVLEARWVEAAQHWRIETSDGEFTANVLIAAPGFLSEPSIPELPGLATFSGPMFHTARWDHDVDLAGRRVAVIGTGASAIQVVPAIQPHVGHLDVFQRTPPWVMPHRDRPITNFERRMYRRFPTLQRIVRAGVYMSREMLVPGFSLEPRLMKALQRLAVRHLESQVPDPELRAKLTPPYVLGCKRVVPSNEWYPALQRPNVDLVSERIAEVRPEGILTADGELHELDVIVFATGFRVTDIALTHRIRDDQGVSMADHWRGSAQAYLGTSVAGFPNFFFVTGPNTGLGHNSLLFMIEAQLSYVLDALRQMTARGATRIDVRHDAQEQYNAWIQRRLERSVWNTGGCASWYLDANGKNTTIWPYFTWHYWRKTRRFDPAPYVLTDGTPPALAGRSSAAAPAHSST